MLVAERYYNYKELTVLESAALSTGESESVEGEEGAIAAKADAIMPEIVADDSELSFAPTPKQWLAAQEKLKEAQLALKEAIAIQPRDVPDEVSVAVADERCLAKIQSIPIQ